MADNVDRTFRINSGFVKSVAEWYSFDQADLRRATETWAKRKDANIPSSEPLQPVSERRITRDIRSILEEAFWASLRAEEGRLHNFALVYQPNGANEALDQDPVVFEKPKAFDSINLAKIAPALHSTQLIGVWPRDATTESSKLVIWGFAQKLIGTPLSLRTIEPGKMILALRDYQKFGIDGQRAGYISEYALSLLRGVFARYVEATLRKRRSLSKSFERGIWR